MRRRLRFTRGFCMISFIIPTYNRAGLLMEAIAPILAIRETPVECIIVDDASTDNTRDLISAWVAQYSAQKIRLISQQSNQGAQAARNRGIDSATGDYFMFLDSDDVPVAQGVLDLYQHLIKNPDFSYAYGLVSKTDAALVPTGWDVGSAFREFPREIAGYHWHTMGALYRRDCVERVGHWNPNLTGSQDWEYQARVKLYGGKGIFIDTLVGYWRDHEGGRVGTKRFRPDYVLSVMRACGSILTHARSVGRCDAALEERIAKILCIHALEWGANARNEERSRCFRQALDSLTSSTGLRALIRGYSMLPSVGDGWLRKRLTKT